MIPEWILHPTVEEVLEKAKSHDLDSRELLHLKSRTFVYPIAHLETLKDPTEYNKRTIVQTLYNVLRWADEAEDGRLPIPDKIEVLNDQHSVIAEIARRDTSDSITDLIEGKVNKITNKMLEGAVDEETRVFVKHFGKGGKYSPLKEMQTFDKSIREILRNCTATMTAGMREALEMRELRTQDDLKKYCDYVAGIVGESLTDLIMDRKTDNYHEIDRIHAKILGMTLQLTNITKNIKEDADARSDYPDARTLFLPRDLFPGLTPQELIYGQEKSAREARENVFESLYQTAYLNLSSIIDYISSIPHELSGYKAFCFSPFISAVETWKRMRRAGAEAVFEGKKEAVKISPNEFENIIGFTEAVIKARREEEFLLDYHRNPSRFSFQSGGKQTNYSRWSPKYISPKK
ncbi:MAG: squalene/phytoene synthase family protein [Nanoarchaeota archaeon]|nr:squalene/phytoene synthase family protein [Nanoarchaeota archaeon]